MCLDPIRAMRFKLVYTVAGKGMPSPLSQGFVSSGFRPSRDPWLHAGRAEMHIVPIVSRIVALCIYVERASECPKMIERSIDDETRENASSAMTNQQCKSIRS